MRSADCVDVFRRRWWNTAYESERYRRWAEYERWSHDMWSAISKDDVFRYIGFDSFPKMTEVDELFYGSSPTPSKQLKADDNIDLSFLDELL